MDRWGWALIVGAAVGCGASPATPESATPNEAAAEPEPDPTPDAAACTEQWVHMPMLISFPTGGTELDAQNRAILQELVEMVRSRDDVWRVRVEGHVDTCNQEFTSAPLSEQRAVSVANELVTMGVPREIIDTIGYGSTMPRTVEDCDQARGGLIDTANRRVEFSLLLCRTNE